MKEGYTHISLVLDKSGSMDSILEDTIGGFNAFLKGQIASAKEGDTFTLLQFSTTQDYTCKLARIHDVKELNKNSFIPNGGTALLDAVADEIVSLGKYFASLNESDRPSKVIFVILTDGEENSSRRTTKDQLNKLITQHTETWKWEFVFLGANQDAIAEAAKYGIAYNNSLSFAANKHGVAASYDTITRSLDTYKTAPVGMNFTSSGATFTASERTASMGLPTANTTQANVSVSVQLTGTK